MRCVLHIGTEKTGTTAIQSWLQDNRAALSRQGVYTSEHIGLPNNREFVAYFQHDLDEWAQRHNIQTQDDKAAHFAGFLDRLTAEIEQAKAKHSVFVITSEHFHSRIRTAAEIRAIHAYLCAQFEHIDLVCYLRAQSDLAYSLYSTAIKGDETCPLEDFLTRVTPSDYYFNFKAIADNWAGVFGPENCHFRLYEGPLRHGHGLIHDFIQNLPTPINPGALLFENTRVNQSLSPLTATALVQLNTLIPFWSGPDAGVNEVNRTLKHTIMGLDSLTIGRIPRHNAEQIDTRFAASNAEFFATYMPKIDGFQSPTNHQTNDETFSVDQVSSMLSDVLTAVLPHIKGATLPPIETNGSPALREIALRFDRRGRISWSDMASLMLFAIAASPPGRAMSRLFARITRRRIKR